MGIRAAIRRLLMCALVIATARSGTAQETVNYGSIRGRVADAQGAVIQGATVTARQIDTNVATDAVTDEEGRFRFPYLRVGAYAITVSAKGFADVRQTLAVTVGSAFGRCHRRAGHRHQRRHGPRSGAQPDRRYGL
jgi:protocatechuate 3,4-dioxygenase beta subunit